MLGKFLPDFVIDRFGPRKLIKGFSKFVSPRLIGFFTPGKANDPEIRRHLLFFMQMIKGRDQFSGSQIPARAENNDRTWLGGFARIAVVRRESVCKVWHGGNAISVT